VDNQIGTRQPTIDTDTDLTSNTLTTTGNVDVGGDLLVGDVNVANDILTNTNNLSSVQAQVDSLIDIFSQGIRFRAYSLSSATISPGQNLPFNNESYDSQGTYDTTTYVYTIDIAGIYLFTFGWYVVSESDTTVNLFRKRSGTAVIIQQSANGTATGDNTSFYVATIAECETVDEIYAYLAAGSCRLAISDLTEPNNNKYMPTDRGKI